MVAAALMAATRRPPRGRGPRPPRQAAASRQRHCTSRSSRCWSRADRQGRVEVAGDRLRRPVRVGEDLAAPRPGERQRGERRVRRWRPGPGPCRPSRSAARWRPEGREVFVVGGAAHAAAAAPRRAQPPEVAGRQVRAGPDAGVATGRRARGRPSAAARARGSSSCSPRATRSGAQPCSSPVSSDVVAPSCAACRAPRSAGLGPPTRRRPAGASRRPGRTRAGGDRP